MLVRAAILLVVTLVAVLPAWSAPEWLGTEGRRVQIALEMVRSGDWMVPTLGGQPTWAKPPLHYWVLAGCAELFGPGKWAMRLPAVVFLFVAAFAAMELTRSAFGRRAGWIAALGMVLSPIVVHEWPTAEIDPTFASLTAMSLWLLSTGVARERRGLVFASGVLAGLAFLQKGPPYLLFAAGAYLVWWRHRGLRFAVAHFAPMVAIPLAYYVPLWLHYVGPAAMLSVTSEETVGRIKYFDWEHITTIPGFWLRAILVQIPFGLWCFWEWRGARDARMDAGDVTLRMCSGAAVVAVVLLTFFPGRPTRYLLPNVLVFGFAVAPAVAHYSRQIGSIGLLARRSARLAGLAGAVGLLVLPFVEKGVPAIPLAAAVAVLGLAVRRPLHVVGFCLLIPFVSVLAVRFDGGEWQRVSRAREVPGRLLRRELDALGASQVLATYGHVDSAMLLEAGLLPPGDESGRNVPTAPWLLCEARDPGQEITGYAERLRLCVDRKILVVLRRRDAPR